jgi:adenylylsulfate kinase-like enzyme
MCIKIIWINGAFGSGKTTTAFEINRRLENSFVYDPENMGYFFRRNMPKEILAKDDFQNETLWRQFNYEIIKNIALKYNGIIIIPMTIYNVQYYREIIERLIEQNIVIEHYILGATKKTIIKRLSKRLEKGTWAINKIDNCIKGFEELKTKKETIYIDTNGKNIYEVIKVMEERSNIKLKEDNSMEIIKKIRRLKTQIKHIRLFG